MRTADQDCDHLLTWRSLYIRTRAGSKTSKLVKIGWICACEHVELDKDVMPDAVLDGLPGHRQIASYNPENRAYANRLESTGDIS